MSQEQDQELIDAIKTSYREGIKVIEYLKARIGKSADNSVPPLAFRLDPNRFYYQEAWVGHLIQGYGDKHFKTPLENERELQEEQIHLIVHVPSGTRLSLDQLLH